MHYEGDVYILDLPRSLSLVDRLLLLDESTCPVQKA